LWRAATVGMSQAASDDEPGTLADPGGSLRTGCL